MCGQYFAAAFSIIPVPSTELADKGSKLSLEALEERHITIHEESLQFTIAVFYKIVRPMAIRCFASIINS